MSVTTIHRLTITYNIRTEDIQCRYACKLDMSATALPLNKIITIVV